MARRDDRGGAGGRARAPEAVPDVQRLLHELEVHQLELELQSDELRAAQVEIETGLRRYAELFDVAPVGYFVVGADGVVHDLNLAAARLIGRKRAGVVGVRLSTFVAPRDAPALARSLRDAVAEEAAPSAGSCEVLFVRAPTGTPAVVRLSARRLSGEPDAVLVSAEDVTAQRHAERALREEGRRKDEFLSALSHELRNPSSRSATASACSRVSGRAARRPGVPSPWSSGRSRT